MVKGLSRRVVVVKSPDSKIFEEAIFIVREDVLCSGGRSRSDILREAERVADSYVKTHLKAENRQIRLRVKKPVLLLILGVCAALTLAAALLVLMI